MPTSTFKTSTIFVSTGQRVRIYRSIEDVPAPLRKRLNANLSGPNSRTLIVADRRGREYLSRALEMDAAKAAGPELTSLHVSSRIARRWAEAKNYWLEIGLIGLLGLASWTLFQWA
jgi:hypothetical protein